VSPPPSGLPAADRAMWVRLYSGRPLKDLPWFARKPFPLLARAVEAGALRPPGPVLDVGCGLGTNVLWLASRGFRATGIDIAPGAISAAESQRPPTDRTSTFRVDDVLASALRSRQFRAAFDVGCFHTLPPRKRRVYAESLYRLLQPDATFLLFWVAREETGSWGPPHRLSVGEVVDSFESGFRVERIEHRPRKVPLTAQLKRKGRPLATLAGYTATLIRRRAPQPPPR
jgi:SAM-dependent methyltransferase